MTTDSYCVTCGNKAVPGGSFCAHCGASLSTQQTPPEAWWQAQPTQVARESPLPSPQPLPTPTSAHTTSQASALVQLVEGTASSPTNGTSVREPARTLPMVVAGCGAFLVIGSFGPWATYFGRTINGMDVDGKYTLFLAAGALTAIYYRSRNVTQLRGTLIALVLLAISSIVAVYDATDINRVAGQSSVDLGGGSQIQFVSVGWGLSVAGLASIVGAVLALILVFRDNRRISG
jgi:hypothetical protein